MIKIKRLAYRDLRHVIGDPATSKGRKKIKNELVTVKLPYTFYNWSKKKKKHIPVNYIRCHKSIAESVIDALAEILNNYGIDKIKKFGLNRECGGSYNHRKTRDGKWWSVHAWGAAVDLWCHMGRYGKKPIIPNEIVQIFKKRGFYWGGDFKYPDGMHFSRVFG